MTGLALGLLAVLSDSFVGVLHIVLVALSDKGFLWASIALAIGFNAASARRAALQGGVCLLIATVTYYGFILAATDRWHGGIPIDGSSPIVYGLLSVGRAAAFWSLATVLVGMLLGYVGFGLHRFSPTPAGLLAGLATGALASGGLHSLLQWIGEVEPFWWINPLVAVLTVLLPVAGMLVLVILRRDGSWRVAVVSFVVGAVLCTGLWYAVTEIRMSQL